MKILGRSFDFTIKLILWHIITNVRKLTTCQMSDREKVCITFRTFWEKFWLKSIHCSSQWTSLLHVPNLWQMFLSYHQNEMPLFTLFIWL